MILPYALQWWQLFVAGAAAAGLAGIILMRWLTETEFDTIMWFGSVLAGVGVILWLVSA